jgi:hypothetical protein
MGHPIDSTTDAQLRHTLRYVAFELAGETGAADSLRFALEHGESDAELRMTAHNVGNHLTRLAYELAEASLPPGP